MHNALCKRVQQTMVNHCYRCVGTRKKSPKLPKIFEGFESQRDFRSLFSRNPTVFLRFIYMKYICGESWVGSRMWQFRLLYMYITCRYIIRQQYRVKDFVPIACKSWGISEKNRVSENSGVKGRGKESLFFGGEGG